MTDDDLTDDEFETLARFDCRRQPSDVDSLHFAKRFCCSHHWFRG